MDIVTPAVTDYMHGLTSRHDDDVLLEMEAYAAEHGFPIVGRLCGVTFELLARAIGARRVFELGSGYGYSGYWFARAVGAGGEVHLTDGDPANEARAADYLGRAGVWDRIRYHVGYSLDALAEVDGDFDIVYCDVDKQDYPEHWRVGRKRVRPGGLFMCDNVLWSGRVTEPEPDELTAAIDEMNRLVAADADWLSTIVPTRDGVLVALRLR